MPRTTASSSQPVAKTPRGLVAVDGRSFPLKSAALRIRAEGGIASTALVQAYDNPYGEPLEVFYTLPLPADGAVIGYSIRLGERIVRGEVERREEAEARYRKALEEGKTAGLLEEERADTFTQALGNLPPGERVSVEIEVLQSLLFAPAASNLPPRWEYRFPTVPGVRYEGEPGRVPDAGRLDPERADAAGTPARLEIELVVADGPPEAIVPASSSHAVRIAPKDAGTRVTLAEGSRLDRDLVVAWSCSEEAVGIRLVEGKGLPGDPGRYGLLTLTPPAAPGAKFARDLTLLLDASGSMSGAPLALAKRVAAGLLQSLTAGDRFEILAFSNDVQELVKGPAEADRKAIAQALERLESLRAGGATEMARATAAALRPLRSGSQRQVILITDGYIGFEQEVVAEILRSLPPGARLHTVGIGAAPNRTLLWGAARAGRGAEILVGSDASLEAGAIRLRRATEAPVLTDLSVGGSAVRGAGPARPPDVLGGQPIRVALDLDPRGGTIEVRGKHAGSAEEWVRGLEVPPLRAEEGERLPLGALFGREIVADAEVRLAAAGRSGRERVLDQIEALGLRHRIATLRTSLVAVLEEPTVDPREPRRRKRLPAELPAGISAEGVGLGVGGLILDRCLSAGGAFSRIGSAAIQAAHVAAPGAAYEPTAAQVGWGNVAADGTEGCARVLRVEGDLLVLEFEAMWDGFLLPGPGDPIRVRFRDGSVAPALVEESAGTRRGPHPGGLTLRLAVRLAAGSAWPAGLAMLRWESDGRGAEVVADLP